MGSTVWDLPGYVAPQTCGTVGEHPGNANLCVSQASRSTPFVEVRSYKAFIFVNKTLRRPSCNNQIMASIQLCYLHVYTCCCSFRCMPLRCPRVAEGKQTLPSKMLLCRMPGLMEMAYLRPFARSSGVVSFGCDRDFIWNSWSIPSYQDPKR